MIINNKFLNSQAYLAIIIYYTHLIRPQKYVLIHHQNTVKREFLLTLGKCHFFCSYFVYLFFVFFHCLLFSPFSVFSPYSSFWHQHKLKKKFFSSRLFGMVSIMLNIVWPCFLIYLFIFSSFVIFVIFSP